MLPEINLEGLKAKQEMANIRSASVFLILFSSGISILLGVLVDRSSPVGFENYRAVYYGARCLIDSRDPYRAGEFVRVYATESGEFPSDPFKKFLFLRAVSICVNLPTTLFLVASLAILPWGLSHVIWLALISVSFTIAAFLVHDLARTYAPRVSLLLICILLANSEVLFAVGNTAGIAVSLCVIAIWSFVKKRYEWLGVIGLGVSLALKPHDSGLAWLFLVVAGGVLRKRALEALAITILLAVPALLWVSRVSPQWPRELAANLAETSAQGDISDPGPHSISRRGSADVIIDLQTVASVFRDDPRFYNPVTLAICASILVILLITVLRRNAQASVWCGLASIAALSMLPSYHRPYDAKLLLLAVPACAMLWAGGGWVARAAVALTTLAATLTGDIPLAIISILTRDINVFQMGLTAKVLAIWLLRPAPLILLCTAIFYTWIYVRQALGMETGTLKNTIDHPMSSVGSHRVPKTAGIRESLHRLSRKDG
jgi:hypothetical protein